MSAHIHVRAVTLGCLARRAPASQSRELPRGSSELEVETGCVRWRSALPERSLGKGRSSRLLPIAAATLTFAPAALGQMQAKARFEGEWLPIVKCTREHHEVMHDGRTRYAPTMEYSVKPNSNFADGFVKIENADADLDPLRNASAAERSDPSAVRFRYTADLIADRSLSDCYAVLTFVTEGSIGTQMVPIGTLRRDDPRALKLELLTDVTSVGTLHVFTGGVELRTNQHPAAYDVRKYYESLLKSSTGFSAAELLKMGQWLDPKLSKDGRLMAVVREIDAKQKLIVYDLASLKLICETRVADADAEVGAPWWVSDHEIAYTAQDDVENYPGESRLHLLDIRTGKTKLIHREVRFISGTVRKHPEVIEVIGNHWGDTFYKLNVHTGQEFDFEAPDSGYYWFDHDGHARLRLRIDGDRYIYAYRPKPDSSWRNLDAAIRQPGLHFNCVAPHYLDRVVDVDAIGPDGDTLYISTRLGTDKFELCAFSLSKAAIVHTIARLPKYDIDPSDGGIARLLFDKGKPQLLGLVYGDTRPRVAWLDPGFAAVQKAIDGKFPDHLNSPLDWSDDGSTFIYFSTSDRDPGTYYALRPKQGALIPLIRLTERLKGKRLSPMVPIRFPARDGIGIPAYVTRPANAGKSELPLLVRIHGGPMERSIWGYDAWNQFFASRGYEVLQVNYRGSSGYGAAFQKSGLYARLDTVAIDDIADGVRYLVSRGDVDPDRVAVIGASFGGWATYISLARYPQLYRAGVAIAAVSDFQQAMRDDHWELDDKVGYRFWKSLLHRGNFDEDEAHVEPYRRAAEIRQPIFIIHGERDRTVMPTESKLMLDELRKHNSNIEARSFVDASHSDWPFRDRVQMLNEIDAFLSRNLGVKRSSVLATAKPGR